MERLRQALRIGVVQRHEVILERVMPSGRPVEVSALARLAAELRGLPRRRLFSWRRGQYYLEIPPGLAGTILRGGESIALPPQGRLAVQEGDRGKVTWRGLTILFELVPEPQAPAPTLVPLATPPRSRVGPVLGALAVLGVALLGQAWRSAPSSPSESRAGLSLEPWSLHPAHGGEPVPGPAPEGPLPEDVLAGAALAEEPLPEDILAEGPRRAAAAPIEGIAAAAASARAAIPAVKPPALAKASAKARAAPIAPAPAAIAAANPVASIAVRVSAEPNAAGRPTVTIRPPDRASGLNTSAMLYMRRSWTPQVTRCYAAGLARAPQLQGDVVLAIEVRNSRATGVEVRRNTSGDPALGECLRQSAGEWKFPFFEEGRLSVPLHLDPVG